MARATVSEQPKRYANLIAAIHRTQARRILEIGTYKGGHAEQMILAAAEHRPVTEVEYVGFDMFDAAPAHEMTGRTVPPPMATVERRLCSTEARVTLVKGDTRVTLPAIAGQLGIFDVIFIDGGHSEGTVRSDWTNVQPCIGPQTVVFFDDYWTNVSAPGHVAPDSGTRRVVGEIEGFRVEILDPVDEFARPWGTLRTQLVRVTR